MRITEYDRQQAILRHPAYLQDLELLKQGQITEADIHLKWQLAHLHFDVEQAKAYLAMFREHPDALLSSTVTVVYPDDFFNRSLVSVVSIKRIQAEVGLSDDEISGLLFKATLGELPEVPAGQSYGVPAKREGFYISAAEAQAHVRKWEAACIPANIRDELEQIASSLNRSRLEDDRYLTLKIDLTQPHSVLLDKIKQIILMNQRHLEHGRDRYRDTDMWDAYDLSLTGIGPAEITRQLHNIPIDHNSFDSRRKQVERALENARDTMESITPTTPA